MRIERLASNSRLGLITLGTIVLSGALAGQAQAALVSCSPDLLGHVTGPDGTTSAVSDCQYIVPPDSSNTASISNINSAGFFGFSDWESNAQTELGGAGNTGGSGSWSIASVNFALYDYIIVFKDGGDTNLVAFLFNESFSSGLWTTPFTDPPFSLSGGSTEHDVSHITIARRLAGDDETPVSEPASLLLLGTGFVLAANRLRRRRA